MTVISDLPEILDEPLDEVQELIWAMVDEVATQAEIDRLEELLLESDEARRTYVLCMQMHADLHFLLGPKPRLPEVLQRILEGKKTAPLPLVDMSSGGDVPLVHG